LFCGIKITIIIDIFSESAFLKLRPWLLAGRVSPETVVPPAIGKEN